MFADAKTRSGRIESGVLDADYLDHESTKTGSEGAGECGVRTIRAEARRRREESFSRKDAKAPRKFQGTRWSLGNQEARRRGGEGRANQKSR